MIIKIANIYGDMNKFDPALLNYKKALKMYTEKEKES